MRNIKENMDELIIKGKCKWNSFWNEEKGDTNFVSIAMIIAIVVALAAAFWTIGDGAMEDIKNSVSDFMKNTK